MDVEKAGADLKQANEAHDNLIAAERLLDAKKYQEAVDLFTTVINAHRVYSSSYFMQQMAAATLKKDMEVAKTYGKAHEMLEGDEIASRMCRAEAYEHLNKLPEALADYNMAVHHAKEDAPYELTARARVYEALNLRAAALEDWRLVRAYYQVEHDRHGRIYPEEWDTCEQAITRLTSTSSS